MSKSKSGHLKTIAKKNSNLKSLTIYGEDKDGNITKN